MKQKLQAHIDRDKIHEETGIEDNGTKPTKISAAVRAQRIWDRIDLIENHKLKDLETSISNISADLNKMRNGLQEQVCELSTYNGETQELMRLLDTAMRVVVHTLQMQGIAIHVADSPPGLSPVSPEDLII